VLSPLVGAAGRHMPRAAATALVFVAVLVAGIAVAVGVLGGITSEAKGLQGDLQGAVHKAQGWLQDAGVSADKAQSAGDDASSGVSSAFHTLLTGVGKGVKELASLAIFLSFTALSLFFLLKDGPVIRGWVERHMGIPAPVAHTVTQRTIQSLRGYFAGVTAVAAFNAIIIGLGSLVLGVPHVGAIALVNFLAAYIPYLGAWSAGAFTVLLTLGSQGSEAAVAMIVIVLLANGALQQMIQPIAFGATLGIHPLAVLIVTIAGGALFGTIGLILAAPLTSAIVHISADLARIRAKEQAAAPSEAAEAPPPG
jgi:putative heme transporter